MRKKKNGFVYLLKSNIGVFKYGCTTRTPDVRCIHINKIKKEHGFFCVIDSYKSKDIFNSEMILKWDLWSINLAPLEFFITDNESKVINIFKTQKALHEK